MTSLLNDAPWVAFERDSSARVYDQWMRKHLPPTQVRLRVGIGNAVAAMLRTALAVGILHSFVAVTHQDLSRPAKVRAACR